MIGLKFNQHNSCVDCIRGTCQGNPPWSALGQFFPCQLGADLTDVDADETLSPVGKANKKKLLAAKAKAAIEKSKAVAEAKEVSARQLAKWEKEFESHLKLATTPHAAAVYDKLWDRCHDLQGAERLVWLGNHAADPTFASALLTAPTAVTGLKRDELEFLREQFEKSIRPQAAEERSLTLQALNDLDCGARNAIRKISQAVASRLMNYMRKPRR